MDPNPETTMLVSRIVSLESESQWIALDRASVKSDLTGERRIRVRRTGKSDPPLIAERGSKSGAILKLPRNGVTVQAQRAPASILVDFIIENAEMKWTLPRPAKVEPFGSKSLNKSVRHAVRWEPGCPHLHRHLLESLISPRQSWIHKQVAEPPCS